MTRADVINIVHDRLGELATQAGFSANETSYGYCVDIGLRSLIGSTTIADVTVKQYNELLDLVERAALGKLRGYYILRVDVEMGPRREKFSQILEAINKLIGPSPVVIRDDAPMVWNDFSVAGGTSDWPLDWWLKNWENWV